MNVPTLATTPPTTTGELLERADSLAGRTLGELADAADTEVPENLQHHKGWAGQLIERFLGADAGNLSAPDFTQLGIELKTLPVNATGYPLETTYVCAVPLTNLEDLGWEDSHVRSKLARVLWVPIHAEREIPIAWRMVGRSILWAPDAYEEEVLRRDWEGHVHTIRDGYIDAIRGGDGDALQVRPKAANSSVKTWTVDEFGDAIMTLPRGFYLRKQFTARLLAAYMTG